MQLLNKNELEHLTGGVTTTLSGTLVNSITSLFKILLEAGQALGSSFRRIKENDFCPLK